MPIKKRNLTKRNLTKRNITKRKRTKRKRTKRKIRKRNRRKLRGGATPPRYVGDTRGVRVDTEARREALKAAFERRYEKMREYIETKFKLFDSIRTSLELFPKADGVNFKVKNMRRNNDEYTLNSHGFKYVPGDTDLTAALNLEYQNSGGTPISEVLKRNLESIIIQNMLPPEYRVDTLRDATEYSSYDVKAGNKRATIRICHYDTTRRSTGVLEGTSPTNPLLHCDLREGDFNATLTRIISASRVRSRAEAEGEQYHGVDSIKKIQKNVGRRNTYHRVVNLWFNLSGTTREELNWKEYLNNHNLVFMNKSKCKNMVHERTEYGDGQIAIVQHNEEYDTNTDLFYTTDRLEKGGGYAFYAQLVPHCSAGNYERVTHLTQLRKDISDAEKQIEELQNAMYSGVENPYAQEDIQALQDEIKNLKKKEFELSSIENTGDQLRQSIEFRFLVYWHEDTLLLDESYTLKEAVPVTVR